MHKKLLSISFFILSAVFANSQTVEVGNPVSWNAGITLPAAYFNMPAVDNAEEIDKEKQRRAATQDKFYKFGHNEHVDINFMQEAEQTILPDGSVLRLMRIRSAGAVSINLVFSEFELAQGAHLFLSDKNKKRFIGAHTAQNNNEEKVLGTDLIYADEIVIELTEPGPVAGTSVLTVGNVVHGFLNLDDQAKILNDSGDCEYDVNCPVGAGWENQRNATGMMVNTDGFCTGSLVNNTTGTIIPYFLTANHCGPNPAGWVFRFRWESPPGQTDCGTPANSVNGPENMNINGGVKKASSALSDFHLILMNGTPDPAWGIYYNGWDRTEYISPGGVGVHHPRGDIKKISVDSSALVSKGYSGCPPDSHWGVTSWDVGVTEGGSSGSPLFNMSHSKRTIGQLHGGASSCSSSQKSDEYGKFSYSWEGEGTSSKRLKDWLDPGNTGADFIDGFDPNLAVATLDAGLDHLRGVSGTYCGIATVNPTVEIYNPGTTTLTSALITYWIDGQNPATYNWTGSLLTFQNETVSLPQLTVPSGTHNFFAQVSLPNGGTDEKALNDTVRTHFAIITSPVYANLSLTMDCFASEINWNITDDNGAILYTGSGYTNTNPGQTITESFCLSEDCYTFNIFDMYGDGIDGGSSCDNGFFTIVEASSGDTLAELTEENADFDFELASAFCMDSNLSLTALDQQLWSVFPNPANTVLNIDLAKIGGSNRITVVNPAGQVMADFISTASSEKIEVAGFAKGVYFLTVTTSGSVATKTFIVR